MPQQKTDMMNLLGKNKVKQQNTVKVLVQINKV